MARRSSPVDDWVSDENAITVFTDGDQAAWNRKGSGWRRFVRWYMILSAIFIPVFALLALSIVVTDDEPPPASSYSVGTDAAQAQWYLEQWLGSNPAPVPQGRVLTFNGQTTEQDVPEDPGGNVQPEDVVTTVTYRFVVADGSGGLWDTSVQTTHTIESGTRFAGSPSLLRIPPFGTDGEDEWPWPGLPQVASANTAIEDSIELWAAALTQSNPSTLKQAIGDPDPTRSYQPVPEMTLGAADVRFMGGLWGKDEPHDSDAVSDRVVVRVTFPISWKSVQVPEEAELPEVTYDLLVVGANSGSPKVVAWNVPGPVSGLTPYMNAVVVAKDSGNATPSSRTSGSPTPGGSSSPTPSSQPTG